jgi:8-oxo-dGTP pyrophosphatase MutT (NUDIX family)
MDKMSFQVTIKGLFFDEEGRVLLVKEKDGTWDLPGGRLEHGEDLSAALVRECLEEMGLECKVLDEAPHLAWSAFDGVWKVVLCYRIALPHLDIRPTDECTEVAFFDGAGAAALPLAAQTRELPRALVRERAGE